MGDGLPPDLVQLRSNLPIRALALGHAPLHWPSIIYLVYYITHTYDMISNDTYSSRHPSIVPVAPCSACEIGWHGW